MKRVPVKPTNYETSRAWAHLCICTAVWVALVLASLHLIIYYVHQVWNYGLYSEEGMKIGIYIIAGSFLFLFIYPDQVRRIFKVKDVAKKAGKAK